MDTQRNIEDLFNAIVKQAVTDYIHAIRRKNGFEIHRLEDFFRNDMGVYTTIDPEYIIRKAKEIARYGKKK